MLEGCTKSAFGVALLGATTIIASSANAQDEPVLMDQAVSDLDPLGTSLRRVDPAFYGGLSRDRMRQLQSADKQAGTRAQFEFAGPGFRATFAQPDYLTLSEDGITLNQGPRFDGAFVEVIPPGTVFHLDPRPLAPVQPQGPDHRLIVGEPIDGRLFVASESAEQTPTDTPIPAAPAGPVELQPWVTAEDLRAFPEIEIPQGVVLPDDPRAAAWLAPVGPNASLDTTTASQDEVPAAPSVRNDPGDQPAPANPSDLAD